MTQPTTTVPALPAFRDRLASRPRVSFNGVVPMPARRCLATVLGVAATLGSALPAAAQPAPTPADLTNARDAYQRGSAAFEAGRYAEAAVELARADELAPNPVALEAAVKAATLADDPVLAMTLVDRARDRPSTPGLAEATAAAREKFGSRVGRLTVRCRADERCAAQIEGQPAEIGAGRWVRAGDHPVVVSTAGVAEAFVVRVDPGAVVDWAPPPRPAASYGATPVGVGPVPPRPAVVVPPPASPGAPDEPSAREPSGISPTWFWVGVGLTGLGAIGTTVSGADAIDKHDAFWGGDDSAREPGQAAQTRTNVLLGVTAAVAVGTAVTGLWLVDWRGRDKVRASAAVGPTGARLAVRY